MRTDPPQGAEWPCWCNLHSLSKALEWLLLPAVPHFPVPRSCARGQPVGAGQDMKCVFSSSPLKPWGKKEPLGISGVGHSGIGCLLSFWKCFVCSALSVQSALICFFSSYTSVDQGMWGNVNIGSPSPGVNLSRPLARKAGIVISTLLLWVKIPCLAKTLCI